jgi:hypothetical protein
MRQTPCIVAEIIYRNPLKTLDLVNPFTSHREFADDLSTLVYSALMSAKQENDGWHKPAYVFSRFVADCARASGIQTIKYPSTRITARNFNLAIVEKEASLSRNAEVKTYTRMPRLV